MAKIRLIDWENREHSYDGTETKCKELFHEYMNPLDPNWIKHWKKGYLYDDVDNLKAINVNISRAEAQIMYDKILQKIKVGGAISEEYITELTGGHPDYTQRLVKAWIAYKITEKQGGMWVIQ